MTWFNVPDNFLEIFAPIIDELEMRANGEGSGSLLRHHIAANVMSTTAQHFESTYLLRPDMVSKLNEWLSFCSHDDKRKRRCVRALANWYETTLHRSSKDCKPLLEPHRDNVNSADLTIVLGITPTSEYRGAALYVSKIAKHGKIWFEKEGIPSRKSVHRKIIATLYMTVLG